MHNKHDVFNELYEYCKTKQVINTHSHQLTNEALFGLELDGLLESSYVSWCGVGFDSTYEKRTEYLSKVRYNSYFVWLEKALNTLYGFKERLSANNWDAMSEIIGAANKRPENQTAILERVCNYERILLDSPKNSGTDNGMPELFAPVFRVNIFSYGYSKAVLDRYGTNPYMAFGIYSKDIDDYTAQMEKVIAEKINSGCVALKSIAAYERTLDFTEVSKERAQAVLNCADEARSQDDEKAFGDYIFFEVCRLAAKYDVPLQCHTGLAQLFKTNAMQLNEAIEKHPDTKFVLFHGSYPYLEDIYALTHNYTNVYPDICWLPLISTSAAVRMIEELIEVSTIDKLAWGCDAHSAEESFSALLSLRYALCRALANKIEAGYLSVEDAKHITDKLLYSNPKQIYKL